MNIYEKQIEDIEFLLGKIPFKSWEYSPDSVATEAPKSSIIFRSDTAFELGGSNGRSVCTVAFETCEKNSRESIKKNVEKDEILLFGKDLTEINGDCAFAHIVFVSLFEKDEFLFEELKDIEAALYNVSLEGYNTYISYMSRRENVRVSKKAVDNGLSFFNVGSSYIKEFKKNPLVKAVKVVFVTDSSFDYSSLSVIAHKVNAITKTLSTNFKDLESCRNCVLKELCDEVDGMKELHLKKRQKEKKN